MKPCVLFAFNQEFYQRCVLPDPLERLTSFADYVWDEDGSYLSESGIREAIREVDCVMIGSGCPKLTTEIIEQGEKLKIIADLDADRFAHRLDIETAFERGIRVVDTTNGSSYPVPEWALGLILVCLRNAGEHFRKLIHREDDYWGPLNSPDFVSGELTEKRVGIVGGGHVGRRLVQLLQPFRTEIRVYDPYLPKVVPDLMGFLLTSLENVLRDSEIIVICAPLTPRTRRLIGREQLDLIRKGAVFVNVSRGPIVDPVPLIEKLQARELTAGLDVFDVEPLEKESPLRDLPNVFLSPHIAGVTRASYHRFFSIAVDEFARFFHGHETLFDMTPTVLANRRGLPLDSRET